MQLFDEIGNLKVAKELFQFINHDLLPSSGVEEKQFWDGFEKLIEDLTPINEELLRKRELLQSKIDSWHRENTFELDSYKTFLKKIGYLEKEPEDFQIETENVDLEVVKAGPQLVVPLSNARYALNAANARWGSLYDALYGTDVISEEDGATQDSNYNPVRGGKVIEYGRNFLDETIPLLKGSHKEVVQYRIENESLVVSLNNGTSTSLKEPEKLSGYQGNPEEPSTLLFINNNLYFEIQFDREHFVGKTDKAGIKDIVLESAVTTIMDCEDSVSSVDASDKVLVYQNWYGLINGDLSVTFNKNGKQIKRTLNPDRTYFSTNHEEFTIPGRSLMFIRNVGHLMKTNTIIDSKGEEVFEGLLDAVVTSLVAKHSLLGNGLFQNSSKGSVYIVKPKMHGPEEVAFANLLFNRVEDLLNLKRNTIKIGVMDEERRTSLNLKACIFEVKERIVFINTGFLDRTGDEIHTSMEAGPMIRKLEMKHTNWIDSYEKSNVMVGLQAGFRGLAQIGKGMWAAPDQMKDMVEQKLGQLKAGASTAWVPSPTAATLHAIHYHQVNVHQVQQQLEGESPVAKDNMLEVPVALGVKWSTEEIQQELNNNAQGILGYVVRWIDQGIGCSKVLDIDGVGLMEDRATLRISSQHMANWLYHGVCTREQVVDTFKNMAKIVDEQNSDDPSYIPMSKDYDKSLAFQGACDLVFKGMEQTNGYTEPILHEKRIEVKQNLLKVNPH